MDVPRRILDDPASDAGARSLIEEARLERPSSGSKQRALVAALGVVGTATVAGTSSALAGLKLGLGVVAVGLAAGGVWLATRADAPAPVAGPSAPVVVATAAAPPIAPAPSVGASDAPRSPIARPTRAPAPSRGAPAPAPAPSSDATRLAEEATRLEAARRDLEARRPSKALGTLDRYARDFPAGELQPEAMALRVEALAASGDDASARALGRRFLARHPGHPAAARVRRAMGETNW